MNTGILTPRDLFQVNVRYTIPTFQRPYVWSQEDQWEPLWDDVRNVAEDYLEELARAGGNRVEAEERTGAHFLGAIVLQQVPVPAGEIDQREVIDGQQRMTTLQLLLDATQQVLEGMESKRAANQLAKLVINDEDLVNDEEPHHVFKLWPTRSDREAFRHAMDNGLAVNDFEGSLIVQAHEFFQLEIRKWLEDEPAQATERAGALATVVTAMLQMVVINLDVKDNPNVIFETLNARGTPLEQSDLIKNFVLSQSGSAKGDDGRVWGDLDDRWWREEVRQGRLLRPRLDMLLNYWLAMRTGDDVSPSKVFDTFRSYTGDVLVDAVTSEIKRDLAQYRRYETAGQRTKEEDLFHYRLSVMQLGVITPVLLLLLPAEHETRIKTFNALESFLVRRMICRQTTKDYNRLTRELARRLQESGLEYADKVVAGFLKDQKADSREWPNDANMERALASEPLYKRLTRGRLRLVLEGIEEQLRLEKSEQSDVPKNLTIEHLMPQSWEDHWPLPSPLPSGYDQQSATHERNQLIHTIGNLSLLSGPQNKGNGPWKDKKKELLKHAVLNLNGQLMNEPNWNEDSIRDRSRRLAKMVAQCWPGPDSLEWGV